MDRSTGCKLFLSVAVLFLLLLGYTPAHAGSATLTWVASSDPNLAGYRVYVGVASGVYGAPTDVGKVTTWTVPNLTAGVTYYFAVTAYNTAGMESSYSNEVSKLIPLDLTPPLLSTIAASNLTVNSATISWSTDKLSDSQIQYGTTTAYGATTPLIATLVTVHSQVLSNLSAGTLYHYRVLSRDALGNLATSADNTFTTPADTTPPSVPGGVSGGALSSSQVTLSWNASTDNVGVVGYRIYRNGSQAATTAATSFTDGGLSANTTYSYSIAAYDAAGNLSAQSTAVAVTTLPLAPVVSAAAASSITSSAATLTGSVNPSGAATSAWFEYGSTTAYGSSTAPVNVSSATSLSAPLTGLVAGTVYHFRLVARNAGGTSVTIDATFSTAAPPTVAPSASSPTPTPGYTLSADPYVWAAAATPFTLSGDDNTAVLSLPFSFPFYGQSYTQLYVSTNGLITFGSANSAFTPQSIPNPSPPNAFIAPFWRDLYVNAGQITIASSAAQVVIAFNGVRDLCCSTSNSFEVILSPDGMILLEYGSIVINGPTTSGIENQDGSNGVTIASVSSNTAFRLTPNGYQSAPSAPSDTTAPSAPSGLTATAISTSQINLTWVASTDNVGVTGYRVYRNGAQVGTSATLSYSDTGLVPSTIYSYTVAAYDAAGNLSGQSAAVSASTPAPPDTTPPVLSSITSGSITPSGAVITWSTNEPSDTQVEYGTTTAYGASTALVSTLVTAHSQNLSGLTSSTLYHYRVKSRDAAGNLAVSGDATFTTTTPPDTTPPSVPAGLTANAVSSSEIDLTWSASSDNVGVVGYQVYRDGVEIGTTASPDYADTGLAANTSHRYTISAYDAAGNVSAQSAAVSASTPWSFRNRR